MPRFQVSARAVQRPHSPKKRATRARQRWFLVVRIVCGLLILVALTTVAIQTGFSIFVILLPVCTSLAITRSQFSNLLHGTPVYGLSTFLLALIYFGGIIGLQLLVHSPNIGLLLLFHAPGTSVLIIAATTLWMGIVFAPARARAQRLIDQRLNRHMYTATQAIEKFSSTLREVIDLDQVCDGLLSVIQQTIQPQAASVWVEQAEQHEKEHTSTPAGWANNAGQALAEKREGERQTSSVKKLPFAETSEIVVADSDPFIAYALNHPAVLEVDRLRLDSPVLQILRENNVEVVFPLANQGVLIGLLTLGPRLNGQEYAHDDRTLLNLLAAQVAPALRVARMVYEQQVQVRERERLEQELRTAQFIQRALLPKEVPLFSGWQIAPYYQPAKEVGGDFYDFLPFADGRLGLIIGDVTGKGVPAALLMATTHTMIRAIAQEQVSPGEVLARVNELLCAEIPPKMFVACFYAILDPESGQMRYANAGQELPYRRHDRGVSELWATGMPLGMLPGSRYEEQEITLSPGESILFYSDGLVEAHNSDHDMFDYERLAGLIGAHPSDPSLVEFLLGELARFTGESWEQEDDLTMVVLSRAPLFLEQETQPEQESGWSLLAEWAIKSAPGNERQAMERITEAVHSRHLSAAQLDNLRTAVAEAAMNAMEHGNQYRLESVVTFQVLASRSAISVRIRDQGEGEQQPFLEVGVPDLAAKIAEQQAPRGWGLFLIKNLVDEVQVTHGEHFHMVELIMHQQVAIEENQQG